jgi:Uma2 family endonuclease
MPSTRRIAAPNPTDVATRAKPARRLGATRPDRFLFDGIDWPNYTRLLRVFESQRLRTTYDNGAFEIMSPSFEHELFKVILGRMVEVCAEESKSKLVHAGSMTLRLQPKKRGLEPDECYWIASAAAVAGRLHLDPAVDPPPDLAIEVEVTSQLLDRLSVYAALGVREVWRHSTKDFTILHLSPDGTYETAEASLSFPWLKAKVVRARITQYTGQDKLEFIAGWRDIVRSLLPTKPPRKSASR